MVPVKKCKTCGRYSDISVQNCVCGAEFGPNDEAALMTPKDFSSELIGEIDTEKKYFVQVCRKCNAKYYITDDAKPIKKCTKVSCGSIRLSAPKELSTKDELLEEKNGAIEPLGDEESVFQFEDLFDSELVLTETIKGDYSIRLSSKNAQIPVIIGREALGSDYLQKDMRISRKHCTVYFRDGNWYVEDLHSANGIAINGQIEPEGAVCLLKSGDNLKLGHHPDSITFIVLTQRI